VDAAIQLEYSDLAPLAPPTTDACLNAWNNLCRGTINYLSHIQPIWDLSRPQSDADGNPIIDPVTLDPIDYQCTLCHTRTGNAGLQVPAAQLDLTSNQSSDDPDYVTSFFHLLQAHQSVSLDGNGNLIGNTTETRTPAIENPPGTFTCTTGQLDTVTNECVVTTPVNVAPAMQIASSRASRFFDAFAATGSHAGRLSEAELKLLKEWLDIGSQYYNNPFEAPEN
jgi:hypothetical protein